MKSSKRRRSVFLACVAVSVLALASCVAGTSDDRDIEAAAYLKAHPDVPAPIAQAIRDGITVVGMTPEEAHRAGGAGTYHIQNDPKWPAGTDPFVILTAQATNPDNSIIELFFLNTRQYGTTAPEQFTARIEHGRVVRIERGKPGA